jgi:Tol biopolymer transport system component
MDVSRGLAPTRLTFGPAIGHHTPVWSPDGKWLAYYTTEKHGTSIARRPAIGGPEETLLVAENRVFPQDWSPDGQYLLYGKGAPGTYIEIWALPMFGEHKPFQIVPSGNHRSEFARFSPDGQWVAYTSDESGSGEVYVMPFRGSGK